MPSLPSLFAGPPDALPAPQSSPPGPPAPSPETVTDISVHSFVADPPPALDALLGSLDAHGVEVRDDAGGETSDAAARIVLFERAEDEVLEFVSAASDGGRNRVLGLSVEGPHAPTGWRLLEAGAADVLWAERWTNDPKFVADKLARWSRIDELAESDRLAGELVGETSEWQALRREVVEAGRFTRLPVLISGETGTGKELIARAIHDLDSRPEKGSFVIVDCTTIVESLSGSEFFGHEKGAFTGALASRDGAFALADRGTLFLDEVGELPAGLQAELLRVIQEGTFKRVGGNTWRKTNFRLICATNRDLERETEAGTFRVDLFYRLAGWRLRTPSLRERRADIRCLTTRFLEGLSTDEPPEVDPSVWEFLETRDYPGNVRELRHLVGRLFSRHTQGAITMGDLPEDERPARRNVPGARVSMQEVVADAFDRGWTLRDIKTAIADTALDVALERNSGKTHDAAAQLGVTDRALQRRRAERRSQADVTPIRGRRGNATDR